MFEELKAIVEQHAEKLKDLTDDQYKVVNEAISAAFYTINEDKLDYLKRAAKNAFLKPGAVEGLSDPLSRVVRDLSAAEAKFISTNFGFELIMLFAKQGGSVPPGSEVTAAKLLQIEAGSADEVIVSGLIGLGLLYAKTPRFGSVMYEWSPLVAKVMVLLRE
jgi:hypothetical protein